MFEWNITKLNKIMNKYMFIAYNSLCYIMLETDDNQNVYIFITSSFENGTELEFLKPFMSTFVLHHFFSVI